MSDDLIEKYRSIFRVIDEDSDGFITVANIKDFLSYGISENTGTVDVLYKYN